MIQHPHICPGSKFIVMGLGVSGKAAVRYGISCGATVYVSDLRDKDLVSTALHDVENGEQVIIEGGGHTEEFLRQADVLFVSPGVSCSTILNRLEEDGVYVVGELALVADVVTVPIVAITGTNGKTTVTSLVGELLQAAGKSVFVGGNIGTPLLDWLRGGDDVDCLVVEVSSFQLEYCGAFRPNIAVLLNITPDHLDRHGSMVAYSAAKMNLFAHQYADDIAIVNGDDPNINLGSVGGLARAITFGEEPHDDLSVSEGEVSFDFEGARECYTLSGTELNNRTGCLNSAPAIYAARTLGCCKNDIERGLRGFSLGEHRMEQVRTIGDVTYYNDSKATNTGAVLSGLKQLKQVILIAGGRDKGDDYSLLREIVRERVVHLICIGEAAQLLEGALAGCVEMTRAESLVEAVAIAQSVAKPGQSVLLSPACASFDMFTSYKHRGQCFRDAVVAL